jgi:hypothetical protein
MNPHFMRQLIKRQTHMSILALVCPITDQTFQIRLLPPIRTRTSVLEHIRPK